MALTYATVMGCSPDLLRNISQLGYAHGGKKLEKSNDGVMRIKFATSVFRSNSLALPDDVHTPIIVIVVTAISVAAIIL